MTIFAALELSVLLVCIWGFIAIMMTGQFAMTVVLACIGALTVGYFLRRNGWKPSQLSANIAAIIVFILAVSIFATTYNLLSATVHLFLFLQVTKYITRRSLSEIRWCYLISLFNIIGASVITTTFTFGPVLIVYIFLILVSLRFYVLAREFERNSLMSAHAATAPPVITPPDAKPGRLTALTAAISRARHRYHTPRPQVSTRLPLSQMRIPRAMISTTLALTIITLGLSGALFSIIPRLATQNLFQNYGQSVEENNVSAFSENVEFGSFTEIQLDNSIALFVEPKDVDDRPRYVRMRGVALDNFDGKAWRRSGGSFARTGRYEYQPAFTTRLYPTIHKFRVLQPAGLTTFLFGDSFPLTMEVPSAYTYQIDRMAQAIWLSEAPPKEFQYQVKSMQEDLHLRRDPTTLKLQRPARHLIPLTRFRAPKDDDANDTVAAVLQFFGQVEDVIDTSLGLPGDSDDSDDETTTSQDQNFREPEAPSEFDDDGVLDFSYWTAEDARRRERSYYHNGDRDNDDVSSQPRYRNHDDNGSPVRYRRRYRMRPRSGPEVLHSYLERCLELPDTLNSGRVAELATEWVENESTTFTKAMAIETRLRTAFNYSLTPRATGNYIESFLFDVQEGHCEYFATSMAVLLRNLGIPSRVVNGFYSTEWNDLSSNFIVRQKDAHSWVEAWMGDNYGWMTFDPTPPGGVARRVDRGAIVEAISRMSDAIRIRWYRYVIDYSFSDQVNIVRYLSRVRQSIVNAMRHVYIPGVTSNDAATIEQGGLSGTIDWRPIAASGAIIFLLIAWQTLRWIGRRRRPQFSVIKFYDDLLKALAHRGISITPGETPREFAARVAAMRQDWSAFTNATDLYYQKKYNLHRKAGNNPSTTKSHYGLTNSELRELSALKKAIYQKNQSAQSKTKPGEA